MKNEIEIIKIENVKISLTGMELSPNLTFDQWVKIGEKIQGVSKTIHWIIGDWLNYGEKKYGETYSQVLDETGLSYGTLSNDKYVSRAIPMENRKSELSFEHHKCVSALEPKTQKKFLDKAVEEGWTVKEMRAILAPPKEEIDKKVEALESLEACAVHYCNVANMSRDDLGIVINKNGPRLLKGGKFEKIEKSYFDFMFK